MNLEKPLNIKLEMDEMWGRVNSKKHHLGFGMLLIMIMEMLLLMLSALDIMICYGEPAKEFL